MGNAPTGAGARRGREEFGILYPPPRVPAPGTRMRTWTIENALWLLPVVVTLAGLYRPWAGVVALCAGLPLVGSPPGGPYLAPLDVAVIAAIVTALRGGKAGPSTLRWPIVSVLVASAVSLLPLAYHPPSFEPRILAGLLASLPGAQTWTMLFTWRAFANLALGVGLYGAARRAFAGRSILPLGYGLAAGLGLVLPLGLAEQAGLVDLGGYRAIGGPLYTTRLHSLFFHSGWLAQFVVGAGPFAVAALVAGGRRTRRAGWGLLALILVSLPLTQQRGAWFATLAQLGVLGVVAGPAILRERRARAALAAVAGATIALGAGLVLLRPAMIEPVLDRVEVATSDLSGRTLLWQSALGMTRERPLLGWGIGAFGPTYDTFHPPGSPGAWPFRATAHSFYLTVLAERGALGLAAFGLLAWALARRLLPAARGGSDPPAEVALGLLLSLTGLAVYGSVQYFLHLHDTELLFWVLVAAASCSGSRSRAARDLPATLAQGLIAVCLILAPVRLLATPPLAARGDVSYGFNEPEQHSTGAIEWTTGRAARRVPWLGETLVLRLANGHPRPSMRPCRVTIRAAGSTETLTLDQDGWREVRIPVGRARRPWLVLELEAQPTFRPFRDFRSDPELPASHDIRELGVVLGGEEWERAAASVP